MTTKQQLATGFLAMVIVGSIAFMPVNAGTKSAPAPVPVAAPATAPAAPVQSANMMGTFKAPELARGNAKDLTYN